MLKVNIAQYFILDGETILCFPTCMINQDVTYKLNIIALDDDKLIRTILERILGSDHTLILTESVDEFQGRLDHFNPDIIFLDLTLPVGNGMDLCRKLRKESRFDTAFILILTGANDPGTIEEGYSAGADDFIRKPLVPYEIKSKMDIFGRIIHSRIKLHNAFDKELQLTQKLYKISSLVQDNLVIRQQDNTSLIVESLPGIIPMDYFELIRVGEGEVETVFKKVYKKVTGNWSFDQLDSQFYFTKTMNMKDHIKFFKVKTKIAIVYCCITVLFLEDRKLGYMLLIRDFPFEKDDRRLIALLADFASLMNDRHLFQKEIEERNSVYKTEIDKIRKIQASTIPDFSKLTGYDVSFAYMPAHDLSGDFFDGFFISDSVYQVVLCDVSGHGIASSYVGNQIRTFFRDSSNEKNTPADVAQIVNDRMNKDFQGLYYFCTVVILQIDIKQGTVGYMSGGHPDALYYDSRRKEIRRLPQTGPLVGMFKDSVFTYTEIIMNDDDVLFVYTDGITEALAPNSTEMYGLERITEAFEESHEQSVHDITYSVLGSMYEFSDYGEQEDDITTICIRRMPNPGA